MFISTDPLTVLYLKLASLAALSGRKEGRYMRPEGRGQARECVNQISESQGGPNFSWGICPSEAAALFLHCADPYTTTKGRSMGGNK